MPNSSAEHLFLEFSAKKLRQFASRIHVCLEKLNDEQIWLRAGDHSNAVGNLCLHLAGNVRQWIMHGVAGQPDLRHRDEEFAARGHVAKDELWQRLNAAVQEACTILEQTPSEDLTRIIRPQNYDVTVMEGIYHVVEHFAQHTGQILYATKALSGDDLGFYRHLTGASAPPPPPAGQETP
ncbi:MAG TPA: DinB family protein [Paludibaculum sp.]